MYVEWVKKTCTFSSGICAASRVHAYTSERREARHDRKLLIVILLISAHQACRQTYRIIELEYRNDWPRQPKSKSDVHRDEEKAPNCTIIQVFFPTVSKSQVSIS